MDSSATDAAAFYKKYYVPAGELAGVEVRGQAAGVGAELELAANRPSQPATPSGREPAGRA